MEKSDHGTTYMREGGNEAELRPPMEPQQKSGQSDTSFCGTNLSVERGRVLSLSLDEWWG